MRKQCLPNVSPPPSQTPGYEASSTPTEEGNKLPQDTLQEHKPAIKKKDSVGPKSYASIAGHIKGKINATYNY